jgi:hypothetical protein
MLDPSIILSGESETRMEQPLVEEAISYFPILTQELAHFTWDEIPEQTQIPTIFCIALRQRIIGIWDTTILTLVRLL